MLVDRRIQAGKMGPRIRRKLPGACLFRLFPPLQVYIYTGASPVYDSFGNLFGLLMLFFVLFFREVSGNMESVRNLSVDSVKSVADLRNV